MKPCFEKYKHLLMSEVAEKLLNEHLEVFTSYCNGVGSTAGFWGKLTYHFIPNTIWCLNITPCSDIHDVEYSIPGEFKTLDEALDWKAWADERFYKNLQIYIELNTSYECLKALRLSRAKKYHFAVCSAGETSFLKGKTILEKKDEDA